MAKISDDLKAFADDVRRQTDENLRRLADFNIKVDNISRRHEDTRDHLKREQSVVRKLQSHSNKLGGRIQELEQATERAAFVLVLIDAGAEPYLFSDAYYTDNPGNGGEQAAVGLKATVQRYLGAVGPDLDRLPIVTRAFASGEGLTALLAGVGVAKEMAAWVLLQFAGGFSQADSLFDFVLVGEGNGGAGTKLMATFYQFVENPCCRHILLACSHDNGYVHMLQEHLHTPGITEKVTLINSFRRGNQFGGLPFPATSMPMVFRNRPLDPGANGRPRPVFGTLSNLVILVNRHNHRIDMPLSHPSAEMVQAFLNQGGGRICVAHQFTGACPGYCTFIHCELTDGERLAMRHSLRRQDCFMGGQCREPACVYGHHCECLEENCVFPAGGHGVDIASWREMNIGTGASI